MNAKEIVELIISNTASQYSTEWKPDKVYSKNELIKLVEQSCSQPSSDIGATHPFDIIDQIDEILIGYEDWMHGNDGDNCTKARKLLIKLSQPSTPTQEGIPTEDEIQSEVYDLIAPVCFSGYLDSRVKSHELIDLITKYLLSRLKQIGTSKYLTD